MRKKIPFPICLLLTCFLFFAMPAKVYADEPVVVVIDPGHGGENLGAKHNGYTEKEINMIVANAMYEELCQYEGVEVYLTREGDADLSLAERAEIAAGKNADLLVCLHFNMSENHTMFGSEVWISAFGEDYQKGYTFGAALMEQFASLGSYNRGIKVRLNDEGTDYYGIIRESHDRNVTTALVEHCYLDHKKDVDFYNSTEKLEQLGRLDATATAQYFRLRSETLGVDYTDYQNVSVALPNGRVNPDETPPDICFIEVADADKEKRTVQVSLSAEDYDSSMLYYSYSVDGGVTFSDLREWPGADTFQFTVHVPEGMSPQIIVNAYNLYDLYTASNLVTVADFPLVSAAEDPKTAELAIAEGDGEAETSERDMTEASSITADEAIKTWEEVVLDTEAEETASDSRSFSTFLKISGICIGSLFILLLIGYSYLQKKRKKRKRRKF